MKKNIFNNVLMFSLTFAGTIALSCTASSSFNANYKMAVAGDLIVYSDYDIKNYFNNTYTNLISFKEISSERKIINNVLVLDQNALNYQYNSNHERQITGTCTIVACTIMADYYNNQLGEAPNSMNSYTMFSDIRDACENKGATTQRKGTAASKVNNCLTIAFETTNNTTRKGNTDWYYCADKTKKYINQNEAIIYDLKNHSTVAIGYTAFDVTYTKTVTTGALWWKKTENKVVTEKEEFIILSEGWGRTTYSLVSLKKKADQICFAEKK